MLRRIPRILPWALALTAALAWAGAVPWETGLPFTRNFTPKEYGGGPQNWDLARDARGLVYLANTRGVLEYDGQRWRTLPMPDGKAALSLAVDGAGKVFVGGHGDLGCLEPDALGRMRFVSLLGGAAQEDRAFSALWRAHAAPDGIYFCGYERLLRVRNGQVKAWRPASSFRRSFLVAGRIYVRESEQGLLRLDGDELRPVPGGEAFRDVSIAGIYPWSGGLLLTTLDRGFFLLKDGRAVPFEPAAGAFFKDNHVQCGAALADGSLALGTLGGGLAFLDARGAVRTLLGPASGLLKDDIKAIVPTPEGHLWILQTRGLSRVQWPWPVSAFDTRNGLDGAVLTLARHRGALYAGTSQGVFALGSADRPAPTELTGLFRKVEGIEGQTWCLLSVDGALLAGNHRGVYAIEGARARRILATPYAAGFLLRSREAPGRVFLGLENGLGALHRQGARWVDEGLLAAIPGDVQSLLETPDGRLWAGTGKNGLWRVTPGAPPALEAMDAAQGLPPHGDCRLFTWRGAPALLVSGSLYTFDHDRFRPCLALGAAVGARRILQAAPDGRDGLWLALADPLHGTFEEGVARGDGHGAFTWQALPRPAEFTTEANVLLPDGDGTVWVGHYQGLNRLEQAQGARFPEPAAMVRQVTTLTGELVAGGDGPGRVDLPFARRGLRFEFAAPGFPQTYGVSFRVKMDVFDAAWSPWLKETYRDYTNLPEGAYVFRVQARDGEGRGSREGTFRLRIRPPWFRTWWLRTFALALAVAAAYQAYRLKTRILKARNLELEARIQKATRDLREREARLQAANGELSELNEQKNTFLGVVAHDLKAPLHGIVLAAEAFERDDREGTRVRGQAIRKEGREMCALIDRFLNVAAMEFGELTARLEPLDLGRFLKEAEEDNRDRAGEKGITVRLHLPGEPLHILGDQVYLKEILDNLLTNALKFSPRGTAVDLCAEAQGACARISVEDQGPGLTDLDKRKLFGRFTRLSARPTAGETSSGLGLFIVKRMVDDLGGRIWVESEPGRGAAFRVELPMATE